MKAGVIRDWPTFLELGAEWDDLLRDSPADSVFLTWQWIRTWVDLVCESVRPLAISLRDEHGRLEGVAPFYLTDLRLARLLSFRMLRIMGDYPTGAEYPDWILRREHQDEASVAVVSALSELGGLWDCIWMPNVAPATGARERLSAAFSRAGWRFQLRPAEFAYVELPASAETYLGMLSKNKRQQLRAELRRVMAEGNVSVVRCETAGDFSRFLDALFDLHSLRRQTIGDIGVFRRKPTEAMFYRRFGLAALERQTLAMFGLEHGGLLKAVQYGYLYGGVYHQMQEGFDPTYEKGAGNVLRWKSIEALIGQGIRGYDFLGEMTEHKRRWGAHLRTGCDILAGMRTAKNALLFKPGIWPTGRYLRQTVLPHAPIDLPAT